MDKFVDALGNRYQPNRFLTYDDVMLLPSYSDIRSRHGVDISLATPHNVGMRLFLPIISANMDTITESKMHAEMYDRGGLGILHRFMHPDDYENMLLECAASNEILAFSVGVGNNQPAEWVVNIVEKCKKLGTKTFYICLDIAHGDSILAHEKIDELAEAFHAGESIFIIAGNVATGTAALRLAKMGVDAVKVGIGPGGVCQTRTVTGHGVPQLSAIMDVSSTLNDHGYDGIHIIADGGIRQSGDIVKALAAGAHSVMIGSLFAGTDQTPGKEYNGEKEYRGQSSKVFMEAAGKSPRTSEGISTTIPIKGSVHAVINDLVGGIRSGMSYSGARSISELQQDPEFIELSQAGIVEGQTHILLHGRAKYNGE